MNAIKKYVILLVFFASLVLPSFAIGGGYAVTGQAGQIGYTCQIYDATNGLPTSDANFVLGASNGYIWIAGYSGIIRYDSSTFQRMPTSLGLTSGRGLFEDSKGRIWVATNDNGVVVVDKEKSRHYTYKDGLPSSSIRIFAEDRRGNVFIGTTAGVAYIDESGKLNVIDDERINKERILKLDSDFSGKIYGQTKNGIVFSIMDCKIVEVYKSSDLDMEKITTIMADRRNAGSVYIGTDSGNLYYGVFGCKSSQMKKISVSPLDTVHWLSFDCDRVWVSSISKIGYLDEKKQFYVLDDLPLNSSIEMTCSDYQGNIWVASARQGIMKIVTNNFIDFTKLSEFEPDVVNANLIYNGLFYIGTDKGLQILDKNNKSVKNALTKFIGNGRVRCIYADSGKNLWISTYKDELGLVCQKADGTITSFTTKNGMPNSEVRCTIETKDGSILAGTNGGLAVIKNGQVQKTFGARDGIKNTVLLTVQQDEDGTIYAGSDGDGIYVIKDDKIERIGRDEGLTSDVIMRLVKDKKRNLMWIVTSNSIQYLQDGVIKNVSSFPYNNNYDLYFDDDGCIWVLSSYGIYRVKIEKLLADSVDDYRLYTIANGLPYPVTGNSFSYQDADGNLYVSGRDGVIKLNLFHYTQENSQVLVDLASLCCDDKKIEPDSNGTYTIPASKGRISIVPAVMDYTMANPLVKVFLEGSDDSGITTQKNSLSSLEYTGLSYGHYRLHVLILDSSEKNFIYEKTFEIVKKPFISELLFVRILFFVFLIFIVGFIFWRIIKSTIISKQYTQIRQAKDEAEMANRAKSRFLANISHEILTPINTIMGMDEMIFRENADNVPKSYFMSIVNYAIDIRKASEILLSTVNEILEMTKIESGKLQLVEQEYDLHELLCSMLPMVRSRSIEKKLKFDLTIDEMLPKRLYGDIGKIKQIVLNLLTNAIKFTEKGGFVLSISMESRVDDVCGLRFSVKDTGIGIKLEDVENIFSAYKNLNKTSDLYKVNLGLDISRKFAELMGGVLVCQSTYGKGSEFIFTLMQKIVDPNPIGVFSEKDNRIARGLYVPLFIAPDADVLIVDDNPMNLNVMKGLLKATKVFVTCASSGEDCLEKIKSSTFNIVFIGQVISEFEDNEIIKKIREIDTKLPVYLLSENSSEGEDFYKEKGFTGSLATPIDTYLLEKTIMKHLPEEIMSIATLADKKEDLKELPENLLWLKEIDEISVEDGIKNSGGISDFIFGLYLFLDTIEGNIKGISDAWKNKNLKLFAIKIRILKTSAEFIGAGQLKKAAAKLEEAAKAEDTAFIDANIEKILAEYKSYLEKLGRLKADEEAE